MCLLSFGQAVLVVQDVAMLYGGGSGGQVFGEVLGYGSHFRQAHFERNGHSGAAALSFAGDVGFEGDCYGGGGRVLNQGRLVLAPCGRFFRR